MLNRWLFFRPIAIKSYDAIKLAINRFRREITPTAREEKYAIQLIWSGSSTQIYYFISFPWLFRSFTLVAADIEERFWMYNKYFYWFLWKWYEIQKEEEMKQTTLLTIYCGGEREHDNREKNLLMVNKICAINCCAHHV